MADGLGLVLLIDDDPHDNFFHARVIRKSGRFRDVLVREGAVEALEYLKSGGERPDLIFLDINMPGMNGWEFLEEYQGLDPSRRCKVIVVMLTTSEDPADIVKAKSFNLAPEFRTKPLTQSMLDEILDRYFQGN